MSTYAILSLLLGLASLIILWGQLFAIWRTYKADHERRKKQATVEYVNNLRKIYGPIAKAIRKKFGDGKILNLEDLDEDDLQAVQDYLSTVEHLAAGVNTYIFDLKIIERMSGSYFIGMYERFIPYIRHARSSKGNNNLYIEFEMMCKDIEKSRKERNESGVIQYS